jgi:riboflavin transporter FmnP
MRMLILNFLVLFVCLCAATQQSKVMKAASRNVLVGNVSNTAHSVLNITIARDNGTSFEDIPLYDEQPKVSLQTESTVLVSKKNFPAVRNRCCDTERCDVPIVALSVVFAFNIILTLIISIIFISRIASGSYES